MAHPIVFGGASATVLPFRDSALRRPVDVVARTNPQAPSSAESPVDEMQNVVSLAHFERFSRRTGRRRSLADPPEGDAA